MTQGEILDAATRRLAAAGIEGARRESRQLLAAAFGVGAESLLAYPERPVTRRQQRQAQALVARRVRREPLSRILGHREFWSLGFRVSAATLVPRPDSETLVEALLDGVTNRRETLRVLDLGTGSGCLLIALLSELPCAWGLGIDLSPAAVETARENARALGVSDRCLFAAGDWADAVTPGWDLVVCNPPYIAEPDLAGLDPEVRCHDPRPALAAGPDGFAAYRVLLPRIPRILAPGGRLALELGCGQADTVSRLAGAAGLKPLDLRSDLAGTPRCLLVGPGAEPRKI